MIFGLALLASYVAADGCQDCGGFDKTDIYTQCVDQCNGALSDTTDAQACDEQCSKVVLEENCCTTTVCPSARRRRGPVSDRELLTNLSYDTIDMRKTSEAEHSLEVRDGTACCAACAVLGQTANYCPNNSVGFAISMAA